MTGTTQANPPQAGASAPTPTSSSTLDPKALEAAPAAAPAAPAAPPAPATPPPAAPTAELVVAVPEGVQLAAPVLERFKEAARKTGLDSPKAQALLGELVDMQRMLQAEEVKAYQAEDAAWLAEVKADPNLGDAGIAAARKAASTLPHGKELAALLHNAGLGNHPAALKFFASLGRSLREDSLGAGASSTPRGPAVGLEQLLYPTMFPR